MWENKNHMWPYCRRHYFYANCYDCPVGRQKGDYVFPNPTPYQYIGVICF